MNVIADARTNSVILSGAAKDLGEAVTKPAIHFRQKKVFEFGWIDPTRVEVKETGAVSRILIKDGGKWKEGPAEMDSISVQALIDKLRDLSATEFVTAGASAPFLEATVVAGEGNKSERVLISKTGDNYFAVRQNEPAVYVLAKTAVEEIQKAAKDVKAPVAAPKPEAKKK